jgi:chemotaxis regulatin CheY-phosphate phosphatase CheZ
MNFNGIIPKNPWVAVAVLGGVAAVIYILFEELNKTVQGTATAAENVPGAIIQTALTDSANGIQTALTDSANGIKSLWNTLIYDPISNLGSSLAGDITNMVSPTPDTTLQGTSATSSTIGSTSAINPPSGQPNGSQGVS